MRRCILLVLAMTALVVGRASSAELSPADVFKASSPSIAVLNVTAKDGKTYLGTAFMAMKDGMAVTAWHVVHDAASVTAEFSDGQQFDVSGLVDADPKRDVALIRIKVFGRKLLTLSTGTPDIGSKAYVIGAPEGFTFSISDGLISQIRQIDGVNIYQFSSPTSPGNSGGPVFDSKGEVIGVVSFQFELGQNLNFAVPSTYVLGLDSTLPTRPWDKVVDQPSFNSSPSTTEQPSADDDLDGKLAASIATIFDAGAVLGYSDHQLRKKKDAFKTGVPAQVYQLADKVQEGLSDLQSAQSDDPLRKRVLSTIILRLQHDQDSINDFVQAVRQSQAAGYWLATSNDLLAQSGAAFSTQPPLNQDDVMSLLSSPAFAKAIPALTTWLQKMDTFDLDINVTLANTVFVCCVSTGGIGDKIGLKPGDVLLSVDGVSVTSFYDFHDKIKASAGKKVRIGVIRDGKSKDWETDVPN